METQTIQFVQAVRDEGAPITVEVRQEIADCGGCGVYYDEEDGEVVSEYCDNHEGIDSEVY